MRILAEQNFRGAGQSCLLARLQGGGGISQLAPRFHFHKDGKAIAFRYRIDFAGRGAHAPADDIETITLQRVACDLFGIAAGFEMGQAAILRCGTGWGI